ncbi:MAG: thymidylate kinase [Rhodospirillales bacterium]|nr:thymidylate kinase [Rhodospirillales bacterium]
MAARGKFITLEGGEGAGKSTQAHLLADWLTEKGISVAATREPGGTPSAEEIRSLLVTGETGRWDPLTETLLHYAARREHVARLILPTLESGQWIICDRFVDSTTAYQGYGQGVALATIAKLRQTVLGDFKPDLTLILDVEPETRCTRTAGRPGTEDRYERMNEAFHERVRAGFHAIAAAEPGRCVVIRADQAVEAVSAAIRETVSERLNRE